MSQKTNALGKGDLFSRGKTAAPNNLSVNGHLRGYVNNVRQMEDEQIVAEAISIREIIPDATQPRRALPSAARAEWKGDTSPAAIQHLFATWLEIASQVVGYDMEPVIRALVIGTMTDPNEDGDDQEIPGIAAGLIKIAGLAGDIRVNGLTNPITVFQINRWHVIETGERRWLAHHLLSLYFPDEPKWQRIPARVVEHKSVWRQAGENSVRQELNAVARARQLALLLMDLHGVDNFEPYDSFENEQDFYAQIADGYRYKVPPGSAEKLLNAMGLQNAVQLRQYRRILRVAPELWQIADDENWTEYAIRATSESGIVTTVTMDSGQSHSPTAIDTPEAGDDQPRKEGRGGKKTPKLPKDLDQANTYTAYAISVLRSHSESELSKDQRTEVAQRAKALVEYWADVARRMDGE